MQDAFRGLDNLTTRCPVIGKSKAALTGLLVFLNDSCWVSFWLLTQPASLT